MRTNPRIFRSAGVVSLGTLSSRLLGLVREVLMAWAFGTTAAGSAFVVAFTIPNLFRRLFGEGALSAAFVPSYILVRDKKGPEAAWTLTRNLISLLILVLGGISLLGMLGAGWALTLPDLPPKTADTLRTLRVMFPYMIGICLAAVMMGVLNSHRKYVVSAFTPCLLNLVWIAALAGVALVPDLTPSEKILWISWAVLGAGVLQFAVQIPAVRALGYTRTAPVNPLGPEVRRVLTLMGPAALGAAVTQVNVLLDRLLAFWVGDYGPTALSYSERLIYLPLGLFATALGTILLPEFSGLVQQNDREELGHTLDRSLRALSFIMLPAAVGLAVLAVPVVRLIFERGEFDALSTQRTARALVCYAPGLVVFSAAKIFIPLFYAHGDTRTPVRVGVLAVGVNLVLNLLFIFTLPAEWKHAGLALGTVASVLLQVGVLAMLTQRRYAHLHGRPLLRSLLRQTLACVPMAAVAVGGVHLAAPLPAWIGVPAAIAAAALVYLATAALLRCPELSELREH